MSRFETDARQAFVTVMVAELTAAMRTVDDQPMPFETGPLDGPIDDRDVGCLYFEGARPSPRGAIVGENYYRIRVFRRWRQEHRDGPERSTLHVALLKLQHDLETALRANLSPKAGHDYLIVREITPNYVEQCVDAQITGVCDNPTVPGM